MGSETPWIVSSQRMVGSAFGVSVKTIESWRSNGMPGEPRAWDLVAIAEWKTRRDFEQQEARISVGHDEEDEFDLDPDSPKGAKYWETRFRRARAEMHEMKLKTERGELVPRDEVILAWAARFAQAKNSLMTLGQSTTTDLLVARRIDKSVRKMLEVLSAPGLPGVPDRLMALLREWIGGDDESAA
ncbi:MAG: hypothetical protein DHS20C21_03170 [Gemmatimonadota bacterium]|nr:MAG: hypothetical protein DHS20C21_03170 [Gemmatimonadota bacterium]